MQNSGREFTSPYRVIVMGKTGSGKSSMLNSLTNSNLFRVGDRILSETNEVQVVQGKFRGRPKSPEIEFIDTPGFFDSSRQDNEVIARIARSLQQIKDGLNLVLFCFPAYEIRMDSSLQASWKFLRLVLGHAVYEHVIIVLTHGNRLCAAELEAAIVRMSHDFVPYIRNQLHCRVRDEVLVYRQGQDSDGLEDILTYIMTSPKYRPNVMEDLGHFWKAEDPVGSLERLLQHSRVFKQLQALLKEAQQTSGDVQRQLGEVKEQMASLLGLGSRDVNQVRTEIAEVGRSFELRIRKRDDEVAALRNDVGDKLQALRRQLERRDQEIAQLQKGLCEVQHYRVLPEPLLCPRSPLVELKGDSNSALPSRPTTSKDSFRAQKENLPPSPYAQPVYVMKLKPTGIQAKLEAVRRRAQHVTPRQAQAQAQVPAGQKVTVSKRKASEGPGNYAALHMNRKHRVSNSKLGIAKPYYKPLS